MTVLVGRKELLRVVSRKQHREMPEKQILGIGQLSQGSSRKRAASGELMERESTTKKR
jgi:hypothetical protein